MSVIFSGGKFQESEIIPNYIDNSLEVLQDDVTIYVDSVNDLPVLLTPEQIEFLNKGYSISIYTIPPDYFVQD